MILHYVYDTHNGSKQLIGCVCRTDEGRLGYSAVHPKDRRKMSRKLARKIALGRAEKCALSVDCLLKMRRYPNNFESPVYRVPPTVFSHLAALAGEQI